MKVTMLLADHVQVAEGKLNVIGGGWTVTGPQAVPFGIGMIFDVPWDRTNERHRFSLELLDQDGDAIGMDTPEGRRPVVIQAEFEVGRPPGTKPGVSLAAPFGINMGPQVLPPGGRFEWRLTVDGETRDEWRLPFSTRAEG